MKALLLIAHGSRRQKSNDEVVVLADKLQATCSNEYQIFESGFLEIATPAIGSAIETCIKKGATSITVLPYFLNSGLHVTKDIPTHIKESQLQFPDIEIKVAKHIGASELMMSLLIDAANSV
jgi:sirohydrochlorin ferrochelatase